MQTLEFQVQVKSSGHLSVNQTLEQTAKKNKIPLKRRNKKLEKLKPMSNKR